ncbi:hypothetical protein RDWZM_005774 [Blomia tropicalis]|uniref:SH2 domain-containing protein n=1 Tax=Blomia tropicalis TaxID=40697 RepID=A0A9Q0M918_BLOTA|nr:hypothetical protein RDWZM_005774 [Blomia tropicalis]
MGFSVQNKHYAPNGNGTGGCSGGISGTDGSCARKVVNSVFNSMASSFNSVANVGSNSSTTLMNHIRSWQRSRRLRSLNKTHSTSVVNPMNNLCYQSMLPKSSIDLTNSSSSDFNFYRTMNHNHHHIDNNNGTRTDPVVSFMNKGEGVIAMQLVNPRVMINENQLYSMNLANESNNFEMSHRDPLRQTLSDGSCYMELELPSTLNANESKGTKDETLINEIWYYGNISREKAIQVVQNCATGSFVVRNSCTKESCFALTVRVPYDYNHNGVAHYLIIPTDGGRYKIKGFNKEFHTLSSLIIHHSIMKEQLPCTLKLNTTNFYGNVSYPLLSYGTNVRTQSKGKFMNSYNSTPRSANIYKTYGGKVSVESTLNLTKNDNQDLMVDIDLDPTYSKILDNFRKVMAHCS